MIIVSGEAAGWQEWVQSALSAVAIAAGFGYVILQKRVERNDTARAAGHLARHSVDLITDRLEALVDPNRPTDFALRGARSAEIIEVLRELNVSLLPAKMIEPVAVIRSAVFAINSRIDEVLRDEAQRRNERRKRLYSAGRILLIARQELERLKGHFRQQSNFESKSLSSKMQTFLDEASAAGEANKIF